MIRRVLISSGAILGAFGILLLSLWHTNQAQLGSQSASRSTHAVGQRLWELVSPPFLPDSPLYIFPMVGERISLMTAPLATQYKLRIAYSDERLRTAHLLLTRGETALALTTITKAEKYVLRAREDIRAMDAASQPKAEEQLRQTIDVHVQTIALMKHSFSDAQKATIDALIEQLTSVGRFP